MTENAHFSVNTRLTRLLGETYRSSEAALKELVDNAWDADARHVWVNLPSPLTGDAISIRDDGSGMTAAEMRGEYLNIASDKRTRSGERTPKYNRKVKGRKGIGKFAGLILAGHMEVSAIARGRKSTLVIDKKELLENQNDLETVPLPFIEEDTDKAYPVRTGVNHI
jgi:HSP90 family molecular chaperone